jgi:nucleoside-diphosphate-sugar epimerase
MSIFITGASGFVGLNLLRYLENKYSTVNFKRDFPVDINESIVIHLAGKAHDLKKVSTPDDYYKVNNVLTKEIFDAFLTSTAKVFITLSSVKAVVDEVEGELNEDVIPNPITHYGKSKLLAEQYILSKPIPEGKRVYILRPCMIHGPGNKGNLNLLYSVASKGLPWPLGAFNNSRSYLSIENLCFIIKELIDREDILSGIYNVADDMPLSTNEIIELISQSKGRNASILNLNKAFLKVLARFGDYLKLPLNSERLLKLTESYVVSNAKIKTALGKPLPVSSREGLIKTFQSFSSNA